MKTIILAISLFVLVGCNNNNNFGSQNSEIDNEENVQKGNISIVDHGDAISTIEYISEKYNADIPEPNVEDFGNDLANLWNFNNEIIVYGDYESGSLLAVGLVKLNEDDLIDFLEENEHLPISSDLKKLIEDNEPFATYETNYDNKRYIIEVLPYKDSETKEIIDNFRLVIVP